MKGKHKWKFKVGKAALCEVFPNRSRVALGTQLLWEGKDLSTQFHTTLSLNLYSFSFLPLWVLYLIGFMSLMYVFVFVRYTRVIIELG